MIVLGIETSCDETSVAIVKKNRFLLGDVLSENTLSQVKNIKSLVELYLNLRRENIVIL